MGRPIEIERKRLLPGDGAAVEARLRELGYRADAPVTEVDTYYSPQHVDYLETVECLRVRQRDDFAEITYKPASDASTHSATNVISKVETNVRLRGSDDADAANRLLHFVGMVGLARVSKTRTAYRHPELDSVVVAIDSIARLGTFVETEVTGDEAGTELLEEVERQLGLVDFEVVTVPYRDLLITAGLNA